MRHRTGTTSIAPIALWRYDILRALHRHGPLCVAELPHRWPRTRLHLRHLVDELVRERLVELTPTVSRGPVARITGRGARTLLARAA